MCCCCFSYNGYSSKCVDIALIVLNSISFILSLASLAIIKLDNLRGFSKVMIILLFLLTLSLLILSIIIRCWRSTGTIKTSAKSHGIKIANAGFALTIILFILCFVTDVTLALDFTKANYPCDNYNSSDDNGMVWYRNLATKESINCQVYGKDYYTGAVGIGQYLIAYFFISYTELAMLFCMFLWRNSKIRIEEDIDGPIIVQAQPVVMQQPVIIGGQYPQYDGQMQPQYIIVQGSGQYPQGAYVMQPNMYGGNSSQFQQQGQIQQQNVQPVQQRGNDNFNVAMKPGVNDPQYSSARGDINVNINRYE